MNGQLVAPKAFISYSWSTLDHQQWVLDVATRLMQDGVQVTLDKWDLKEGGDKFEFMEQIVSDAAVTKVLIICDQTYKDKADSREGGVGTESTILTPALYSKKTPNKFAALVVEKDHEGNAFTPAFWAGRIYIDFSNPSQYEERYEQLLRWCLDKPLIVKPPLGRVPDFINLPDFHASATLSRFKRADTALREVKTNASGLVREYVDGLIDELKKHAPQFGEHEFRDDAVFASIDAMRPYARQFSELQIAAIRYSDTTFPLLITAHERLARLMFRADGINQWSEDTYAPYEFIAWEAFIRFIAVLLGEERYDLIGKVLAHPYLVDRPDKGAGPSTDSFSIFGSYVPTFEQRKTRLKSNRIDPQADLVHDGNQNADPPFARMMEADFLLFLRDRLLDNANSYGRWYPRTLIYAARSWTAFPLFARSESLSFFERWSEPILNGIAVEEFKESVKRLEAEMGTFSDYRGLGAPRLANVHYLGTKP